MLTLAPQRNEEPPIVTLDDRYYALIADLGLRFPHGAPSLLFCDELKVQGDVRFGDGIVIKGSVQLVNPDSIPLVIENGTVLKVP
ncbi:MAG: UTP--glucose-1-phosphate uridylyltransferase [Anaerolineales bacterium]|nr:UTP--glucose-1-phosphate uridylyltransferase [Anaerolineales bacterium]